MAIVYTLCPTTRRPIATGIETDRHSFDLTPPFTARLKCPHCGGEHEWSKEQAWLSEDPPSSA
jgi:hypothetical protein